MQTSKRTNGLTQEFAKNRLKNRNEWVLFRHYLNRKNSLSYMLNELTIIYFCVAILVDMTNFLI